MEWKWSPNNNEPYSKSLRQTKNSNQDIDSRLFLEEREKPPDFGNLAYSQSLSCYDTNGWETDNFLQNQQENSTDISFKSINKREDTIVRMAEREMMAQIGQNPFLNDNNYVKNVVAQDLFLKPVNTTNEHEQKKEAHE